MTSFLCTSKLAFVQSVQMHVIPPVRGYNPVRLLPSREPQQFNNQLNKHSTHAFDLLGFCHCATASCLDHFLKEHA